MTPEAKTMQVIGWAQSGGDPGMVQVEAPTAGAGQVLVRVIQVGDESRGCEGCRTAWLAACSMPGSGP